MPDLKTTQETLRSPIDGTELVRLATTGANWKAPLSSIFNTLRREVVTTDRTYYVNKNTGIDTNDGLTALTPFLTIQKAVDVVSQTLYIEHCNITIQLQGSGVWNQGVILTPYAGTTNDINSSGPTIQGTAGNRTDITLAPVTPVDFFGNVVCCQDSKWTLQDITLDAVNVNAAIFDWAIVSVLDGDLTIVNPSFGQAPPNSGYYIESFHSKVSLECNPPNTNSHINIGGGSSNLNTVFYVCDGGSKIFESNVAWVLDGNPNFDAYVSVLEHSSLSYHNSSWTGAATGRRFQMRANSRITITGSDTSLTALPGNAAGEWIDSTCWYNNVCLGPLVLGATALGATNVAGEIDFVGKTSGTTKLRVADAAYTGTIKLPAVAPTNGYAVTTDGSGNWTYSASGGGSAVTEDTLKNILALTPTSSAQGWATDQNVGLIADGTTWWVASEIFTKKTNSYDIGEFQFSNRAGYGQNYITDKLIANCTIGYGSDPGTNNGQIRFNAGLGTFGAYEQYSNGAWHPVVVGLVLTEAADMSQAITQTPIGKVESIIVFNGDSTINGLNGLPLIQGYIASMGAYPTMQTVSGGSI